jgi:hypothetical protein
MFVKTKEIAVTKPLTGYAIENKGGWLDSWHINENKMDIVL